MGPSLARRIRRAADRAGKPRRVIGVARFSSGGLESSLRDAGIETITADLLDPAALTWPSGRSERHLHGRAEIRHHRGSASTWAMNTCLPGLARSVIANSRIVAFSTGNVYPLVAARGRRCQRR